MKATSIIVNKEELLTLDVPDFIVRNRWKDIEPIIYEYLFELKNDSVINEIKCRILSVIKSDVRKYKLQQIEKNIG